MTPPPQGRQLAQLVRQLWKEQEQQLLALMRQHGAFALQSINLEAWQAAFIERIKPIYARYLIDGRASMQARLERKRSKSLLSIPYAFQEPEEPDEAFTIYNPEAVNFINTYSYAFAASTLATTKLKLSTAYARLKQELTQGIEQGEALRTITADVMRIFRDPQRAMTIAATEVSRAYHAGQEVAAQQSGVVAGKRWLASSDACPQCLALDGKVVALGEPFIVLPGGGPYAVVMYPPLHPRCFCSWTEVLKEEWNP